MPLPLFIDPQSPKLQTLGLKRAQEKGALVILPVHPRKPGQAWQHHSFRVSLNALSKGTAVTTGLQVPGYKTWLLSESQHCPRLRADSTLKMGQGRVKMDSGDGRGSSPNVQGRRTARLHGGSHTGCRWDCTCPTFWSFQGSNSRRNRGRLFSFLPLSSQEGEGQGMAGNSREGWTGRARCYPRCSWPGERSGRIRPDPYSPSDRGNLRAWRGKEGP